MKVFVTGGTGLVGSRLARQLLARQDTVVILSRRAAAARAKFPACTIVEGDPMQAGPWMDALADCDAAIHLAGENIFARRWSDEFKALLYDSRIRSTQNVVQGLTKNPNRADGSPKILVSTSAIGYYGPHGDEELDENSPAGHDAMARICVDWENMARTAEPKGARVAIVRVGVVLDKEGGALAKLLTPFKLCVGGPVGSGKQWMSWIHHEDLVGLFLLGLDNASATGPLNGTAPNPVTNREFGKALGRTLGRPSLLWTPGIALRVALGEVAEVITNGQRVLPKRPLALGYAFKYPDIDFALRDVLK